MLSDVCDYHEIIYIADTYFSNFHSDTFRQHPLNIFEVRVCGRSSESEEIQVGVVGSHFILNSVLFENGPLEKYYLHVSGGNLQICCCCFEHGAVAFEHRFIVALQLNLNLLVQFVRDNLSYRRNGRLTFSVKKAPAQQSALACRATRA
jgi:hypothetical protein